MDGTSNTVGVRGVSSLEFAGDMVLLTSAHHDLKNALVQFVAEAEADRIQVQTSESETMILN